MGTGRIKGETIILVEKKIIGEDPFGEPIVEEELIPVDNVLLGAPSTDQIVEDKDLNGRRLAFILGIPKGDEHEWTDTDVFIRGNRFRTYGVPLLQTEANVPARLPWNLQVKVERYE